MRLVHAASASVDGYVAGPGGDMSWLTAHLTDGSNDLLDDLAAGTTALLVGARTYAGDDPNAGDPEHEGAFGSAWHGPQVVLTHHPVHPAPPDVIFATDLDRAVALLREVAGDGIVCVLGADVAAQLLRRGLLDEIVVHTVPALLGSGVRMFADGGAAPPLNQLAARTGPAGVTAWYRVRRPA